MNHDLIDKCKELLVAYRTGQLGQTIMPEDSHPDFRNQEEQLAYFTLPMALNYQRDSYTLWQSALKTFEDADAKQVFCLAWVAKASEGELREKLLKYKLALQPNKHIQTWHNIAKTIHDNWGTLPALFESTDNDFLKLRQTIQIDFKKGFPYLSGPKIFNYWSFIISTYGNQPLSHREYIDIAPDTHITQCSVKLGIITQTESETLPKEKLSNRWRDLLAGSDISPIDMHPPLWFWSKNGFMYNFD